MRGVYFFEAKGIQRYLFESGRLRDVIGASELVGCLVRSDEQDLLGLVCGALQLGSKGRISFSRRAAGSFMAHGEFADLARLQQIWRLAVELGAPGLEFTDALSSEGDLPEAELSQSFDGTAKDFALKNIVRGFAGNLRENSIAGLLPMGTPYSAYSARTGRAAVDSRGLPDGSMEPIDAVLLSPQRAFGVLSRSNDQGVAGRFLDKAAKQALPSFAFPRNLGNAAEYEDTQSNPLFPFLEEDRWIALVHADLSGLGQVWRTVTDALLPESGSVLEHFCEVSDGIEAAIGRAAQAATRKVLLPAAERGDYGDTSLSVIPARPLVLGGDDVTVIVRADLALNFTRVLLEAIEVETELCLKTLAQKLPALASAISEGKLPSYLSACAGIAYAKASQPFTMANALAESLCKFAKDDAKKNRDQPFPSAVAFHMISTSVYEDYKEEILKRQLTALGGRQLTLQPLYTGRQSEGGPSLEALDQLVLALSQAEKGRGKLLSLQALLFADSHESNNAWARWVTVFTEGGGDFASVAGVLDKLGVSADRRSVPFDHDNRTPIFDALALLTLGHRPLDATTAPPQTSSSDEVAS